MQGGLAAALQHRAEKQQAMWRTFPLLLEPVQLLAFLGSL